MSEPTSTMAPAKAPETVAYSLIDLVRYALRLGALGFGGPVALVGYMHRDLVQQRHWISEVEYTEGLAVAQLAPGPLAAQLAIYRGYVHYRVCGAALGGAASVVLGFSSSGRLALLIERGRFIGIMRSFFDARRGCGVATAASVIALLFDRDKVPSGVFFCAWLISVIWSIGNLIYCLYFFEMIVKATVAPSKARGGTGMSTGTEIEQATNEGKHPSATR